MFYCCENCYSYLCKCFSRSTYAQDQTTNDPGSSTQEDLKIEYPYSSAESLADIKILGEYQRVVQDKFSSSLNKYEFNRFGGYIWLKKRHKNLYDPIANDSNGWKIHASIATFDVPRAWPIFIR